METHLLEEVDNLKNKELTEEEAFLVATNRIGAVPTLNEEFNKVNLKTIWKKRMFWLLGGYLLFNVAHILAVLSSQLFFLLGANSGLEISSLIRLDAILKILLISGLFYFIFSNKLWSFMNKGFIKKGLENVGTFKKLMLFVPILVLVVLGKFLAFPFLTIFFSPSDISRISISNLLYDQTWIIALFISFLILSLSINRSKTKVQHI